MRPGDDVGVRVAGRLRRVARVGRDHDRVVEERRVLRDRGELLRELAADQVQRAARTSPQAAASPAGWEGSAAASCGSGIRWARASVSARSTRPVSSLNEGTPPRSTRTGSMS